MVRSKVTLGLGTLALVLGLSSCGKDEHAYNYTYNGCSTGDHSFDSKDAYCEALKNHSLNNGCAYRLRFEAFSRDCSGKAWS